MTIEEQKKQYALDELLHPEGKPWEWWDLECECQGDYIWTDMIEQDPDFDDDPTRYSRKPDAPDWDQELSPKEVRECKEWPLNYSKNIIIDIDWMVSPLRGYRIWNKEKGFCDFCTEVNKQELLDHFKKLRKEKLGHLTIEEFNAGEEYHEIKENAEIE